MALSDHPWVTFNPRSHLDCYEVPTSLTAGKSTTPSRLHRGGSSDPTGKLPPPVFTTILDEVDIDLVHSVDLSIYVAST